MRNIIGYYSRNGYKIELNGQAIYEAGNHANDSQAYVDPDNVSALSLEMIEKFCWRTANELASERGIRRVEIELDETL